MTATATTALTPLEFPGVEPDKDSPELRAFKKKVMEEAQKHTRSFHCGSLGSTLKNLGIVEEKKKKITVVTSHPYTFSLMVYPSELVVAS